MPVRMAADKPAVVLSGQSDPARSLALIGRPMAVPAGQRGVDIGTDGLAL